MVACSIAAHHGALAQQKRERLSGRELEAAAAALTGGDRQAAAAAAAKLGQASNGSATRPLIDALEAGLAPEVSFAALRALEQRADARSRAVLSIYAVHRRATHRAAALAALGALRGRRSEEVIVARLSDPSAQVRAAAARAVARRRIRSGVEPLLALLDRNEAAAPAALAAMADRAIARQVAEHIGKAPDAAVAACLGDILLRSDFGPDAARVEVIKALATIPGDAATEKLAAYVASVPEKPPRPSRAEAERLLGERL